jgi:hypothetical protein
MLSSQRAWHSLKVETGVRPGLAVKLLLMRPKGNTEMTANYYSKDDKAQSLIGKRIQIPVHYNLWMQGARYGTVTGFRHSKTPGTSDYVLVKMDHPQVKRRLKLWRMDWDYATVYPTI